MTVGYEASGDRLYSISQITKSKEALMGFYTQLI
jgi:hypothetical protein